MNEIEAFANHRSVAAVEQMPHLTFKGPIPPIGCLHFIVDGFAYVLREAAQAEGYKRATALYATARAVHGSA
jgi:hypothetical protein